MEKSLKLYIAGPMRGIKFYNFPAFDAAAEYLRSRGHQPINPADIDREHGFDATKLPEDFNWKLYHGAVDPNEIVRRDLEAILTCDAVVALSGWEESRGAQAEVAVARWVGKPVFDADFENRTYAILP